MDLSSGSLSRSPPGGIVHSQSYLSRSQSSINDSDSSSTGGPSASGKESPHLVAPATSHQGPRKLIHSLSVRVRRTRRKAFDKKRSARNSGIAAMVANSLRVYCGPALLDESAAEYKTVFANEETTAREVVDQAIQRMHLDRSSAGDFILCDTVGRLEYYSRQSGTSLDALEELDGEDVSAHFIAQYSRLVHPSQHPQLLAQLWQPTAGFQRRFVLHPSSAVPDFRSNAVSMPSSPAASRPTSMVFPDETEPAVQLTFTQRYSDSTGKARFSSILADELSVPFLVTLSCNAPEQTLLAYALGDKVTTIGRSSLPASNDHELNIALHGDDIMPVHCSIRCTEYRRSSQDGDFMRRTVYSLEPVNGAQVAVNGEVVSGLKTLKSGDLVQLGLSHAFVFRDPEKPTTLSKGWTWLPRPPYREIRTDGGTRQRQNSDHGSVFDEPLRSEHDDLSNRESSGDVSSPDSGTVVNPPGPLLRYKTPSISRDNSRTSMASDASTTKAQDLRDIMTIELLSEKHEDAFLQVILTTADVHTLPFPLSPAAAVCLTLQRFTRKSSTGPAEGMDGFTSKVAEAIQEVVWVSVYNYTIISPSIVDRFDIQVSKSFVCLCF